MKAKLIVDGHEFDIDILDPRLQKLIAPKKKTGYERAAENFGYYFIGDNNKAYPAVETMSIVSHNHYNEANYYSDKTVAENNARADKLMRQLRRFAVEHRVNKIDWADDLQQKYYIWFDHNDLRVGCDVACPEFGSVIFDSEESCKLAIETFKDELTWYFTEYKDSL